MQNTGLKPCPFCGGDKLKIDKKSKLHGHIAGMGRVENHTYSVTLCKNCPINKWNEESGLHNDCMESLRLPEVSKIMLKAIKGRRIDKKEE